jgi:FG-GAP-like repeat
VLLGFGDGTFVGKKDYAAGNGPSVVVSADFIHDGNLDLAVPSTLVANSVSILLGNGDGTFQPKLSSTTGPLPFAAAVGDLNGDGSIDLVTPNMTCPNQPCGPGSVSVLLGKGDGTLQPYVEYATGVGPLSVTVGDFNGDGKLDLAVANWGFAFGNTASILLGNGDGTFRPHVDYFTGNGPRTLAAGDFNGDGKVDLAVGNTPATVSILLGRGDGTFHPHVEYQTAGSSFSIAVADFNGDGRADLAVGTQGLLSILLGNGDGSFQPHVDYPLGGP